MKVEEYVSLLGQNGLHLLVRWEPRPGLDEILDTLKLPPDSFDKPYFAYGPEVARYRNLAGERLFEAWSTAESPSIHADHTVHGVEVHLSAGGSVDTAIGINSRQPVTRSLVAQFERWFHLLAASPRALRGSAKLMSERTDAFTMTISCIQLPPGMLSTYSWLQLSQRAIGGPAVPGEVETFQLGAFPLAPLAVRDALRERVADRVVPLSDDERASFPIPLEDYHRLHLASCDGGIELPDDWERLLFAADEG